MLFYQEVLEKLQTQKFLFMWQTMLLNWYLRGANPPHEYF